MIIIGLLASLFIAQSIPSASSQIIANPDVLIPEHFIQADQFPIIFLSEPSNLSIYATWLNDTLHGPIILEDSFPSYSYIMVPIPTEVGYGDLKVYDGDELLTEEVIAWEKRGAFYFPPRNYELLSTTYDVQANDVDRFSEVHAIYELPNTYSVSSSTIMNVTGPPFDKTDLLVLRSL